MSSEVIQGLLNASALVVSGITIKCIVDYFRNSGIEKSEEKYNMLAGKAVEIQWREQFLPRLAHNIAITRSNIDDYVGKDFDISGLEEAFNPYGPILSNYIRSSPEARKNLRSKLSNLVSEYRREAA
ncbi:hypothetical protein KY345_02355 [Candidatus Woesearchaeota archaeon]|nr:hypothetical protein [Candidatus Woesearchaeota archaeon]